MILETTHAGSCSHLLVILSN